MNIQQFWSDVLAQRGCQAPELCLIVEWLGDDTHKGRCAELIQALINKPL